MFVFPYRFLVALQISDIRMLLLAFDLAGRILQSQSFFCRYCQSRFSCEAFSVIGVDIHKTAVMALSYIGYKNLKEFDMKCSECGREMNGDEAFYCPKCGATVCTTCNDLNENVCPYCSKSNLYMYN